MRLSKRGKQARRQVLLNTPASNLPTKAKKRKNIIIKARRRATTRAIKKGVKITAKTTQRGISGVSNTFLHSKKCNPRRELRNLFRW